MKQSILIIDTDTSVSCELEREGYLTIEANNCKDALQVLIDHHIDLILLETNSQCEEWELIQNIIIDYTIPILIHTTKSCNEHKLRCFTYGVDDYIHKSTDKWELLARIRVALKTHRPTAVSLIRVGPFAIDKNSRDVYLGRKKQSFSRREYDLIEHLVLNQNIVFSRETLLDSIWGYDYLGETRTVDTHIKKIRDKIDPSSQYIKTIWGKGYKLESV